jgi:serine/threonine protein phosphatase PrpC
MADLGFEFCAEKISEKGEDAPPIRMPLGASGWALFVCDGMGGAGSFCYAGADGKAGARIAAEAVRGWTQEFFEAREELSESFPGELHVEIYGKLRELADELDAQEVSPSRLRSKLHKRLPTTFAGLVVREDRATAVWAGDSRCFCLSPEDGLQQLSQDDQKEHCDPFESLSLEPQMSNYVNADTEFSFQRAEISRVRPTVYLVATDGCFQYVETPAHFEQLLVARLLAAESVEEWGASLMSAITAVAGDDASMALQAVGWASFDSLRKAFRERLQWLTVLMRLGEPSESGEEEEAPEDRESARRRRELIWQAYKTGYCAKMPDKLEVVSHAAG